MAANAKKLYDKYDDVLLTPQQQAKIADLTASFSPKATAAELDDEIGSDKLNLTAMAAIAKKLYDKYDDVLLTDR